MENLMQKGQWCALNETTKTFNQPDFARFKLNYCSSHGSNPKGYKTYYSLDWNNKTGLYDEQEGLRGLITRMILEKPPLDTRWAALFVNLSLNLSTKEKNYNYMIAYFRGHRNTMPRFKPCFHSMGNGIRIEITPTLIQYRELQQEINNNRLFNRM